MVAELKIGSNVKPTLFTLIYKTKLMVAIVRHVRAECKSDFFMVKSIVHFDIWSYGLMICKIMWHHYSIFSLVNFYNNKNILFSTIHANILLSQYKMVFIS